MYLKRLLSENFITFLLISISLLVITVIGFINLLLFHSIVELFGTIIVFSIFIISTNTYIYSNNDFFVFLGIVYFNIGILIFLQTLSFEGLDIFNTDANLTNQLWIASRLLESVSLVIAFRFFHKKINYKKTVLLYFFVTSLIIISIFTNIFPECFSPVSGITPFKLISEHVVILILSYVIYLINKNKKHIHSQVYFYLFYSFIFSIVSELFISLSSNIFQISNIIGHFLKVIYYFMLYKAFVEITLKEPNKLLFYKINQAQKELQSYNLKLIRLNKMEKLLSNSNNALININSTDQFFNKICYMLVKDCGYNLAWIGEVKYNSDKSIEPIVCIGTGSEYVENVKFSWGDNIYGNGPVGKAVKTCTYHLAYINEYEENLPWRYFARKNELLYVISLPLMIEEQCTAVLNIYTNDKNNFAEGEIKLLLQLSKNLSYGIELVNTKVEKVRNQELLKESEEKFRYLFNNTNDIIFLYSLSDFHILEANNAAFETLKYTKDELFNMKVFDLIGNKEGIDLLTDSLCKNKSTFEQTLYLKNNETIPVEFNISTFKLYNTKVGLASIRNITDRKKSEEKLMFLSYHDILTGLYNRRYFELKLYEYAKTTNIIALIICDIDELKLINDKFGHLWGDELIKTASAILSKLAKNGIISRIGGDEFAILFKNIQEKRVINICEEIRNSSTNFIIENEVCTLNISAGYSFFEGNFPSDVEQIYKIADDHMYTNKKSNKQFRKEEGSYY